jgi:uncharacterized protein YegL
MKKGYTHIAVVLDRSGSMDTIKSDTIGGFNTFLRDQKNAEGTATFTLTQFDHQYETVYNMVNIQDIPELNDRTFEPRGMTALYDAVCRTIDAVGRELHSMRESSKPEKVVFVIITDGAENASEEFNVDQMKERIELQQNVYNWEFVFLAANQDAVQSAQRFSIKAANAMSYTASPRSVTSAFGGMSEKLATYRAGGVVDMGYTSEEREEQEKLNNQ